MSPITVTDRNSAAYLSRKSERARQDAEFCESIDSGMDSVSRFWSLYHDHIAIGVGISLLAIFAAQFYGIS